MKDLAKKVAVAIASGALLAQSLTIPALGSIDVIISGNGTSSSNDSDVSVTNTTTVNQTNDADISNNISASATTGNNDANDNTGDGDVSIDTGNAKAVVDVSNTVNSNEAVVDCGGCSAGEECCVFGTTGCNQGTCYCTESCETLGYECGFNSICGSYEYCGDCSSGSYCNGNGQCVLDQAGSCAEFGFECGWFGEGNELIYCESCIDT